MDIVPRNLHLELLRRKVSIEHETAHILPPYTSQLQIKKHRQTNLRHWILAPPHRQVYTRLGAGCTEQSQTSWAWFPEIAMAKAIPLAIFNVSPQARSSQKFPVSVL
jgi:hypothetical protein